MDNKETAGTEYEYSAPNYEVLNHFSIPYTTFKHLVSTLKDRYAALDGYSDPIKLNVLNDLEGLLFREMAAVATGKAQVAEKRAADVLFKKLLIDALDDDEEDDEDQDLEDDPA